MLFNGMLVLSTLFGLFTQCLKAQDSSQDSFFQYCTYYYEFDNIDDLEGLH